MEDFIDEVTDIKEKRGRMLAVLCVLSWIFIGLVFFMNLLAFTGGKASAEEMKERKIALIDLYTGIGFGGENNAETIEELIFIDNQINENFYLHYSTKIVFCLIGFFAVLQMYRLQKMGFWAYIAYSLIPIGVGYYILKDSATIGQSITWDLIMAGIFIALYASQVKRMA